MLLTFFYDTGKPCKTTANSVKFDCFTYLFVYVWKLLNSQGVCQHLITVAMGEKQ